MVERGLLAWLEPQCLTENKTAFGMLVVQLVPHLEEENEPTETAREYWNSVFNFTVVICPFYHSELQGETLRPGRLSRQTATFWINLNFFRPKVLLLDAFHYSNQAPRLSRPSLIHWGTVSQQAREEHSICSYNYAGQRIYNLLCNWVWQGENIWTKDHLISPTLQTEIENLVG